jgi:hypothetical protein
VLGPPSLPSAASAAPITLTPTLAVPPSPTAPPTPAPAALSPTGATASSVVGNRAKFAADMAIDGDPATCWQEGKAQEQGEWLEVTFAAARVDAVLLWNGYQLSEDAYYANRRLRDVEISVDGGVPLAVRLPDQLEPFRVELGGIEGATRIRITIVTTYDPRKTDYPGSPFDDAALSEVEVIGVPAS